MNNEYLTNFCCVARFLEVYVSAHAQIQSFHENGRRGCFQADEPLSRLYK